MARTARRFEEKKETGKNTVSYRAGIYTRLSNERTESWRNKSSSIETQILNCKEYALRENIQVVQIFKDYEYSGTNFDRPDFQNMMQAVRERRINCIIVRDLSRLGREYLEMGRLIDKVFPFLGVRFISVSDNLDTLKAMDSKKSFEVTIKNIINDMYAKDISVKVKTSKLNRARKGYFIGSVPPYGYKVIKTKEGQKLEIDDKVSFIVQEIFELTLKGHSQIDLADVLNKKAYATPMIYYKTGRVYREEGDPEWNAGSLGKILINPSYIGDLVQGVRSQSLAEGKKQHHADKKDYIVVKDAHEALISEELFEKVQKVRKKRLEESSFSAAPHDFKREAEIRFRDLIFYEKTGEKLVRRSRISTKNNQKVLHYLYCRELYNGKGMNKKSVFIMEEELDERIISDIQKALLKMSGKTSFLKRIRTRYAESILHYKDQVKLFDDKIEQEERLLQKTYENYSLGRLDRDHYLLERDVHQGHMATLEKEKACREDVIREIKKDRKEAVSWVESLYSAKGLKRLTGELINQLVEKVIVYDRHDFDVFYKFDQESRRRSHDE